MPNGTADETPKVTVNNEVVVNANLPEVPDNHVVEETFANWDLVIQTARRQVNYVKRGIRALALLGVGLLFALVGVYYVSNQANKAIDAIHKSAVHDCKALNVQLTHSKSLWLNSLADLEVLVARPLTPEEAVFFHQERVLIYKTFVPQNCTASNPLP